MEARVNEVWNEAYAGTYYDDKHDANKLPVELLPVKALKSVAAVLQHGLHKYSAFSWMDVPNPMPRYYASALRHMFQWAIGEQYDESGHSHLAHAATNLLFLVELEAIEEEANG